MNITRYDLAAATVGNTLFAIGGAKNGGPFLSSVEAYDPTTNTWAAKASMNLARGALAAASVGNTLYALGGLDSYDGSLSSVEAISASAESSPLATVGHVPLTRLELSQTQKAQSLLANSALADTPAFVHLVGDTLQHEVAVKHGVAAAPADLDALAAHANATSKAPELLIALKTVFGADTPAYRRLYLQPIIESAKRQLRPRIARQPAANRLPGSPKRQV